MDFYTSLPLTHSLHYFLPRKINAAHSPDSSWGLSFRAMYSFWQNGVLPAATSSPSISIFTPLWVYEVHWERLFTGQSLLSVQRISCLWVVVVSRARWKHLNTAPQTSPRSAQNTSCDQNSHRVTEETRSAHFQIHEFYFSFLSSPTAALYSSQSSLVGQLSHVWAGPAHHFSSLLCCVFSFQLLSLLLKHTLGVNYTNVCVSQSHRFKGRTTDEVEKRREEKREAPVGLEGLFSFSAPIKYVFIVNHNLYCI